MPINAFKEKTKQLVVEGKLNEALRVLLDNSKQDSEINDIIIQSGRYHDLQKREENGTISNEDYQRDLNKLRLNILNIIDSINTQSIKKDANKAIKEAYQKSIARIAVLKILEEDQDGLSIKALQDGTGLKNRKYIIFALNELIDVEMVERFRVNNQSLNKLSTKGRKFVNALK